VRGIKIGFEIIPIFTLLDVLPEMVGLNCINCLCIFACTLSFCTMPENVNTDVLINELEFQTSRSGGKGGQHVNKTESRVQVFFDVEASQALTVDQKARLIKKGKSYLTSGNVLQMDCDSGRSQAANRQEVIEKLLAFIKQALKPEKKRKKTRVPRKEKKKRLENKRKQAEKKQQRKPPEAPE
jgi:ribosome-associated protein